MEIAGRYYCTAYLPFGLHQKMGHFSANSGHGIDNAYTSSWNHQHVTIHFSVASCAHQQSLHLFVVSSTKIVLYCLRVQSFLVVYPAQLADRH